MIRDRELPVPFELGQFIAGLKYEWSQQVRTNGPVQRRPQKAQISPRYNSTLGDDRRSDRPVALAFTEPTVRQAGPRSRMRLPQYP